MIKNKQLNNYLVLFLTTHLVLWVLIPSLTNVNLPLDTIEALAWGSNLAWGFNKHPPLSAFAVEIFYKVFGNRDWAYYLLSQIFVVIAFIAVFKFAKDFFKNGNLAFLSVLLLEGIFFYNFTTPEFNVNVAQLPFWALSVYYTWKCFKYDKAIDYILLGLFIGCGILSKYIFIYLLLGIKIFFIYLIKNKQRIKFIHFFITGPIVLIVLFPHLIWLFENNFVTFSYGIQRTGGPGSFFDHINFPVIFILKQCVLLVPFFLMLIVLIKKIKFKIKLKDNRFIFLFLVTILPIFLMFLTSVLLGAKIRTMWMTPFYLFFGVFFIYIFQNQIKNLKKFTIMFLIIFLISPISYAYISITKDNKRTDFPGKEIAYLVQKKWDKNFSNDISIIVGDEWYGGNLSYHLESRPKWFISLDGEVTKLDESFGIIYTGNPKVLKKICPGEYGTIKPVGYCMIGMR